MLISVARDDLKAKFELIILKAKIIHCIFGKILHFNVTYLVVIIQGRSVIGKTYDFFEVIFFFLQLKGTFGNETSQGEVLI